MSISKEHFRSWKLLVLSRKGTMQLLQYWETQKWCGFQGKTRKSMTQTEREIVPDEARWRHFQAICSHCWVSCFGERWNRLEMTAYTLPKSKIVRFTVARALWLHTETLITDSLTYQNISSSWLPFLHVRRQLLSLLVISSNLQYCMCTHKHSVMEMAVSLEFEPRGTRQPEH